MSPPPAGRRTALGRLVDALRGRVRPDRRSPPATVPGLGSGEETAVAEAARPQQDAAAADADARFDAARERLRARIEPPDPDDD